MATMRKISGLVFAGLLMTSAIAPVASASTVSDLFAQYPDGGDDFEAALGSLFDSDPLGTASAIAQAWASATDDQKSGAQQAIGGACTGNTATNANVRSALPFTPSGTCPEDSQGNTSSAFRRTTTGTNNGSGFGGGSISPNTQQNNTNDNGPQ
ncbi:MAG TPA: hypothetical protein PL096_09555 [Micropepsaceae bacterium]|nr:hypothetical protein [Micropepsaceae bacterium]